MRSNISIIVLILLILCNISNAEETVTKKYFVIKGEEFDKPISEKELFVIDELQPIKIEKQGQILYKRPSSIPDQIIWDDNVDGKDIFIRLISSDRGKVKLFDEKGKLKKEIDNPKQKNIVITENGSYFGFLGYDDIHEGSSVADFEYFNIEGNLLWRKAQLAGDEVYISPKGDLIVSLSRLNGAFQLLSNKGDILYERSNEAIKQTLWTGEYEFIVRFGGDKIGILIKPTTFYFSSNPFLLYVLNNKGKLLWKIEPLSDQCNSIGVSKDGRYLVTAFRHNDSYHWRFLCFDMNNGKIVWERIVIPFPENFDFDKDIPDVQINEHTFFLFSDNAKFLVIASNIFIWFLDNSTGSVLWKQMDNVLDSIVMDSEAKWIIKTTKNSNIFVYLKNGSIKEVKNLPLQNLKLSKDGRKIGSIKREEIDTNKKIKVIQKKFLINTFLKGLINE